MDKRSFIKNIVFSGISLCVAWPLYRFVTAERYRPPEKIKVTGGLKTGEYVMDHDFTLFVTEKGPLAVSRHCTHLGCIINYHEKEKMFICPCHQSRFAWNGRYISGPAKKDLPRYVVHTLEDDKGYLVLVT